MNDGKGAESGLAAIKTLKWEADIPPMNYGDRNRTQSRN